MLTCCYLLIMMPDSNQKRAIFRPGMGYVKAIAGCGQGASRLLFAILLYILKLLLYKGLFFAPDRSKRHKSRCFKVL
jgi:hypothetical protein